MKLIWCCSLLVLLAICDAKKKAIELSEDDVEQLEQMIKKVEKLTKHNLDPDSEPETTDNKGDKQPKKNPCENHKCSWGKECIVNDKGKPVCECAKQCPEVINPDPSDKACSNQNETFDSICHLYRARCLCKNGDEGCTDPKHKKTHLEYLGQCKELEPCTDALLAQFPARMADWLFQVMKDLKKRQELHGDDWIRLVGEAESNDQVRHIYPVIWKFCDLDVKPHDSSVTHHELIPITAPVMPMESCIKPFLKTCDENKDEKITLKEWGKCLGLKEEEIIEKC